MKIALAVVRFEVHRHDIFFTISARNHDVWGTQVQSVAF